MSSTQPSARQHDTGLGLADQSGGHAQTYAARATIPGRLVLGNTSNWPDLPAYAVGIALGALAEWRWRGGPTQRPR